MAYMLTQETSAIEQNSSSRGKKERQERSSAVLVGNKVEV